MTSQQETPKPPVTAEYGACAPDGPIHDYPPRADAVLRKRSVGPYDNGTYLLRCAETGDALLIDGANRADLLIEMIGDASLVAIAQTHGHPDHVQALEALLERFDVPVLAHPGDWYPVPTKPLDDGDIITVGRLAVRALHTPGHTPGSTSFLLPGHLFSGDTLFPGGPGNTFGNARAFTQIMGSLDRLFAEIGDDVHVSPGHGSDTTIGWERGQVDLWRARGW